MNFTPAVDSTFCQSCALGKHHQIYGKISLIQRTKLPSERLYSDFFSNGDFLSSIKNIYYRAFAVDNASCIKILITLKTKDNISQEIINTINKTETQTRQKVKFF